MQPSRKICQELGISLDDVRDIARKLETRILATCASWTLGDAQALMSDVVEALICYGDRLHGGDRAMPASPRGETWQRVVVATADQCVEAVDEHYPAMRSNAVIVAALVAALLEERYLDAWRFRELNRRRS